MTGSFSNLLDRFCSFAFGTVAFFRVHSSSAAFLLESSTTLIDSVSCEHGNEHHN